MSASNQQCFQAKMFLTVYQDAVKTLEQAAINKKDKQQYDTFLHAFLKIHKQKILQKLIHPSTSYSMLQAFQPKFGGETIKTIRLFQYSHYVFLKYLPTFDKFNGDSNSLIKYIKQGNASIQQQLNTRNPFKQ